MSPPSSDSIMQEIKKLWEVMNEGRVHYTLVDGKVNNNKTRIDHVSKGVEETREDISLMRDAITNLTSVVTNNARKTQEDIHDLSLSMNDRMGILQRDVDRRFDQLMAAISARRATGPSVPTLSPSPLDHPDPPLPPLEVSSPSHDLSPTPVTSALQGRRAVAVGGGGAVLTPLLMYLAQLSSLSMPVQWALGALALCAGFTAIIVAGRWGWRAAGR